MSDLPYPHLLTFGDWQRKYAAWLNAVIGIGGKVLLDVGTAYGAQIKAMIDIGCYAVGCDKDPRFIEHCPWREVKKRMFVWDVTEDIPQFVINQFFYNPMEQNKFQIIHTHALLEHIPEDKIPIMLKNLKEVADPWAIHFHVVTIAESPEWQKIGDPDHVSIFPYKKWLQIFKDNGYSDIKHYFQNRLLAAEMNIKNFYAEYQWGLFILLGDRSPQMKDRRGIHGTVR